VEKWRKITTQLLPERQSASDGLAQFESDEELKEWLQAQHVFSSYDTKTVYQNLRAERRLVEAEREQGITRTWDWREGEPIEIEGFDIAVPSYRLDTIHEGNSTYRLPIFFTRFSNRASSAMKTCFDGAIWEEDERTGELCLECGRSDRCSFHSKYVIDHRMLAGHEYESEEFGSKVIGIGLQEQFAGPADGNRVITIQRNYTDKVSVSEELRFEQFEPRGFPQNWEGSVTAWKQNFTALAEQLADDSTVTLQANPMIVNADDCLDCVYRDLCTVPNAEVDLQ
jgi:hypothetical protein